MNSMALNVKSDGNWAWRIEGADKSSNSLNSHIETHAGRLRAKYLSFIADLSEFDFNGKSLAEHFQLRNDYNIWWMSLLAEKSVYKSPSIADCIKLLALEEVLSANKPSKLELYTTDSRIKKSIEILCSGLDIEFSFHRTTTKVSLKKLFNLRVLYLNLPHPVRAILFFFKHLLLLFKTKRSPKPVWYEGANSILFFSYFIHLDKKKADAGVFYSRQWEILPQILNKLGIECNWLHHFLKSDVTHNITEGSELIDSFNKNSSVNGMHSFINNYSGFYSSIRIIKIFFSFLIKSPGCSVLNKAFKAKNSAVSFWPLLKEDWKTSFYGTTAIENLVWIFQLDQALREMPMQKLGFYLQENQGWERGMIAAWKKYGHGTIIGVPHSTIRFWDLRYYDDEKIVLKPNKWSQLQPDFVALNGPYSFKAFKKAGYPLDSIVCLEALRYLNYGTVNTAGGSRQIKGLKNVIILGDIMVESTKALLSQLQNISPNWASLSIKLHPGGLIDTRNYPALKLVEEKEALGSILPNYDTAIVVGSTTAALDAYLGGLKVILFLMEGELNMSPLMGFKDVSFVKSATDLEDALNSTQAANEDDSERKEYFWSDSHLPRWRELLNHYYKN
jgi:surface carbohydrate biosynthesis protein (TIGR04326 family)